MILRKILLQPNTILPEKYYPLFTEILYDFIHRWDSPHSRSYFARICLLNVWILWYERIQDYYDVITWCLDRDLLKYVELLILDSTNSTAAIRRIQLYIRKNCPEFQYKEKLILILHMTNTYSVFPLQLQHYQSIITATQSRPFKRYVTLSKGEGSDKVWHWILRGGEKCRKNELSSVQDFALSNVWMTTHHIKTRHWVSKWDNKPDQIHPIRSN